MAVIDGNGAGRQERSMDFVSRITRLPHAFDPDRGQDALGHVPGLAGDLAGLIEGTGGCSPYLSGLIAKEAAWLVPAFDGPEAALEAEFARLHEVPAGDLGDELRRAKRRVALMTALADLAGVWPLEEVTGRLTAFADLAVELAIRAALAPEIRRGKLPGAEEADLETAGGWVARLMPSC